MRQVTSRLRELAERQSDLNKQLRELQSALQAARDETERQEIEEQIKRLRDQQQEMLRDADELASRMERKENEQNMANARERMSSSRDAMQQSMEQLERGDVGESLATGTRAERELESIQDDLRQQTASQFADDLREMREASQQLVDDQQKIESLLDQLQQSSGGLRDAGPRDVAARELEQQGDDVQNLLDQMEQVIRDSEATESLLANRLYDTFREARQSQLTRDIDVTRQLLQRGLDNEIDDVESRIADSIAELREGVEQAAESVLGNSTEALRRAASQLDELASQLDDEIRRETDGNRDDANGNDSTSVASGQPSDLASTPSNTNGGDSQGGRSDENGAMRSSPSPESPSGTDGIPAPNARDTASRGSAGGQEPGEAATSQGGADGGGFESGLGAMLTDSIGAAPLTGDAFRDWSDQLRDIEEMVDVAELRDELARVRQRARDIRRDFVRHSREPQWSIVRDTIAVPLERVTHRVREELIRRTAQKNGTVPIDRDPVPPRYADAVRKYYEQLGSSPQ